MTVTYDALLTFMQTVKATHCLLLGSSDMMAVIELSPPQILLMYGMQIPADKIWEAYRILTW